MAKGKRETPAGKAKNPAGKKAGKAVTATKTRVGAASKSATQSKKVAAATKTKAAVKSRKTTAAKGKGGGKKIHSLPHLNDIVLRQIIAKLDDLRSESVRVVNLHMHEDLKQREESGDVGDDMDQPAASATGSFRCSFTSGTCAA